MGFTPPYHSVLLDLARCSPGHLSFSVKLRPNWQQSPRGASCTKKSATCPALRAGASATSHQPKEPSPPDPGACYCDFKSQLSITRALSWQATAQSLKQSGARKQARGRARLGALWVPETAPPGRGDAGRSRLAGTRGADCCVSVARCNSVNGLGSKAAF